MDASAGLDPSHGPVLSRPGASEGDGRTGVRDEDAEAEADRTRRLRSYEADPVVVDSDEADGAEPLDFFSPFGPMIAKLRAPRSLVESVNRFVDERVREHAESLPRAGARGVLGEIALPQDFVTAGGEASLAHQTAQWISRYVRRVDHRGGNRVRFELFWIVRQFAASFSPVHFHTGDISGVLYLRVPDHIANEAEEEERTYISARRAGYITFFAGGKQRYARSLISFKPEVGDFYLFPGWLLHAVEPFDGAGERRSLAFNAFVD
jgi:hypothetical protein